MYNKCGNMHGATLKIVDAKQARLHKSFKNTKCKLLRTNAAIWMGGFYTYKHVFNILLVLNVEVSVF